MSSPGRGARPLALVGAAVVVLAMVSVPAPSPSSASGVASDPPEAVLEHDMRGEQAVRALGDRLPAVAAQNGRTPAEFRADLRQDRMLWVGRTGQLLFVDEFGADHDHEDAEVSGAELQSEAVPSESEVFSLHSRPGADRVLVLDFDGHDYSGTAWAKGSGGAYADPYSQDTDPTTFNDAERAAIHSIWQRVAEDFAPFAVDVTTADVSPDRIRRDDEADQTYGTRVVITPTQAYKCSCGGVAYVGVFDALGTAHDYYQPAWVFTSGVGTGAKNVAEAASHEAGHNLGLSHDGTETTGYYKGHETWAPIMGVGYHRAITQWSRGEYSSANNQEDDFTVIHLNGAPSALDDHGDAPGTATTLGTEHVAGLISDSADVDVFEFPSSATGVASFSVRPSAVSPNLDVGLWLLDGDGITIASALPPSSASVNPDGASGLDAHIVATVDAGTYYLVVDGVGFGSPSDTGYSDYGSVGRYTVSASLGGGSTDDPPPDDEPAGPPSAPTGIAVTATGTTVTVSWNDTSHNEVAFEIVREQQHKNGSWRGTTVLTRGADVTTLVDEPGAGTYRYQVRAVNEAGESAYTGWVEVVVTGSADGGGGKGGGKPTRSR